MPKTILITGSSTGLGRATALRFARHDWRVIATMRNPDAETELTTVDEITVLPLDVTDRDQIAAATRHALSLGPVDVVFNNAGYGLVGPFEGTTDEQIIRQVETNLLGAMRVTQAFIPAFRERGEGTFISTTSIGGLVGFPFNSVYHATKFALEGWSESLALELGKLGIRVKTIAPGGIATDFAGRSLDHASHGAYAALFERVMARFADPVRIGGHATAEQVAEVVFRAATDDQTVGTYLAGADANALFGQRLAMGIESFRRSVAMHFFG